MIQLRDGKWGAFEIKLGVNQVDAASSSLLALSRSFEENGDCPPSVLAVICGMSSAVYRRPDGVYVVPVTALRP